jgi:hypothetical protein
MKQRRPRPEEQWFPFTDSSVWQWVPSRWVTPGAVVPDSSGRYWRLVVGDREGWTCEEVAAETVGSGKLHDHVRALRLEIAALPPGPASRVRLEQLREELMDLCNSRKLVEPSVTIDPFWTKRPFVIATGIGFIGALTYAVRTFATVPSGPRQGGQLLLAGTLALLFFIGFLAAFVPFVFARYPEKMRWLIARYAPSANLVGAVALILMALTVAGAVIVWLGLSRGAAFVAQ